MNPAFVASIIKGHPSGQKKRRERIFIIAYATSERCNDGGNNREGGQILSVEKREMEEDEQERNRRFIGVSENHPNVSNTNSEGLQRNVRAGIQDGKCGDFIRCNSIQNSLSNGTDEGNRQEGHRGKEGIWNPNIVICAGKRNNEGIWATEPDVGRMADGVPFRVDRIKCLGNAVVPQIAQVIGEMILEMLT